MLKSVLYSLLLLTTATRFIDIIYLLAKDHTNLPVPVILVTTAMVLYGMVLLSRKFFANVRLKQLQLFYIIQSGMIIFNIAFLAIFCPLEVSALETLAAGTFLDLIINVGAIYLCVRQTRGVLTAVR